MADKIAERQFILEFLKVYRSLSALWDVKCKEYSNRVKKNEQYNILLTKYQEYFPDADKQEMIKKINSLRTNFRKELKRIRDANKSGAGAEDVETTLWYFEEIRFLQNQSLPTSSISTMSPVHDSGNTLIEHEGNGDTNDGRATSEDTALLEPPKKKTKKVNISDDLMEIARKRLQEPPDEHDKTAAAWAVELRKMNPSQQTLAKKGVNDILFEGVMGTLHRDSVVINNPSRTSTPFSTQSFMGNDPEINMQNSRLSLSS